ncbi:MAG: hypothetical protein D6722_12710, partial [Bacteroidetes bacterium]
AQEERFSRVKHDAAFPTQAIGYCLQEAGVTLDDVDYISFFEKPLIKFERLLETYLASAPSGFSSFRIAMPLWIKDKLFQKDKLIRLLKPFSEQPKSIEGKLLFSEHHQSHAASAFYPSPFEEAVVLTVDGVGEWATASVSVGRGTSLEPRRELHWPHSLGLLYSAFTYYLGFKVNSGEYKVMGLAPYGEPEFAQLILDNLIDVKPDGSFWLDQSYFNYVTGLTMTNPRFEALFGQPRRLPEAPLTQFHMNVAASIQAVTEEVMMRICTDLARTYATPNLCLAGGVALNCVANGKLHRAGLFDNIWIQPAAGDAGGAVGAAYQAYHGHLDQPRRRVDGRRDSMKSALLGPAYSHPDIVQRLRAEGAVFKTLGEKDLIRTAAESLAQGKVVG